LSNIRFCFKDGVFVVHSCHWNWCFS